MFQHFLPLSLAALSITVATASNINKSAVIGSKSISGNICQAATLPTERHTEWSIVPDDENGSETEEKGLESGDVMPQFPGGEVAMLKWIAEHVKYPETAQESNIQGRVVVQFVVTKTGSIGKVKIVRSVDPDLDKEAVRVIKSLPRFYPGKVNGKPVNVWMTLPISFKLQEKKAIEPQTDPE